MRRDHQILDVAIVAGSRDRLTPADGIMAVNIRPKSAK